MKFNEYTVGEIVSTVIDYRGKTPKKLGGDWSDNGYRALSAKNIKTGRIVQPETIRFVNAELYKKWMKEEIQKGDIIITSEAPFGQVYFWNSDEKIVLSQRLFAIRCNKEFYPNYIYQYMTTAAFQGELENRATGTTVMGLRQPELMKCLVYAPSFIEQKKIASILYALDDKIELNNKINENLEQQAQAIFKSWFVDFEPWGGVCPVDWKEGSLQDYVDIKRGGSPRPIQDFLSDYGYRWLKISDVTGLSSPYILDIKEHIKESGQKKTVFLKAGSLVLSNSATPGIPKILDVDSCIHDGWLYFSNSQLSNEFLYLFFKHIRKELVALGNGSVFTNLKTDILKMYSISMPSQNVLSHFDGIIKAIFSQINNISRENKNLSLLRDALLPKLMSGEIDVSEIEI